jgi:hypothetical protein
MDDATPSLFAASTARFSAPHNDVYAITPAGVESLGGGE